jgi:molybdenum cofactor cytidylyltransferase
MKRNTPSESSDDITAVILAAGRASRMGREKLLLKLGGQPVIQRVVGSVRSAGFKDVIVIANPRNEVSIRQALADVDARLVCNPSFEQGLASSIAAGVAAVGADAIAMLLVQGDQPLIDADMLRALVVQWRSVDTDFVAASYDDVTTTPVLFGRSLFAEMMALRGDVGAKSVLRNHSGRLISFPAWRGTDLDTEDDYVRVQQLWQQHHNVLSADPRGSL